MTQRQFDIAAWILRAFVFGFAVGVASSWDWFPDPDDWGLIAIITNNMISYLALTLPWLSLLAYAIARRKLFKDAR